jgi:predicted phage baseplate assembly protein
MNSMGGNSCTCGCCEGVQIVTPTPVENRPGLPALSYRAGTHATFLETMIAWLSSSDCPALAGLKTRDPGDPAIALLDSWATVADILTFYQERIANEGYLRTATERRSVLELARLIGYTLRPGVAASVYLAYTLSEDNSTTPPTPTETTIPKGSQSQSVPNPGESPQFFETSSDLDARSAWNKLQPRLTQPQNITEPGHQTAIPQGTDARIIRTVYLDGISTNLQPSDGLLIVLGYASDQQFLRFVESIDIQADQNRTEVTLQTPVLKDKTFEAELKRFAGNAADLFPGNPLASQVVNILKKLSTDIQGQSASTVGLVQSVIPQIQQLRSVAAKRNFTRLGPWLDQLISALNAFIQKSSNSPGAGAIPGGVTTGAAQGTAVQSGVPPTLTNLGALVEPLAKPPSLQPANSARLARNVTQTFSSQSDTAPKLLGALKSIPAPVLYQAWANTEGTGSQIELHAFRVKAALFASSFAGAPTLTTTSPPAFSSFLTSPTFADASQPPFLALDAVYDKILPGTWVAVQLPAEVNDKGIVTATATTYHRVESVNTLSKTTATEAFTAKVTQLELYPPLETPDNQRSSLDPTTLLRQTVVYAQAEELDLSEEPLDRDIQGNTIELDGVYEGLDSGRWIIVSGARTDIPNVTGVSASELVMVAGVQQESSGSSTNVQTKLTLANKLAYTYDPGSVTIYGNVVDATNGATRKEVLGNGDGTQIHQQFTLKGTPLTFVPASNPTGVDSTLQVYVNNVEWEETDSLAGLGPKDRKFITATDDNDNTTVAFGDGINGARLPTGTGNVNAIYRTGIGAPGDVEAGQISLLQTRPLNVSAVINPLAASGGADRDRLDQARCNAPLAVLALDRLVSVQDYADFSRTFAGIGKASAARLSDGQRTIVHVTIAGTEDIPIAVTSDLYQNLVQALQVNGDPYEPIQVAVRKLKLLVIAAQISILSDYLWESVVADLRATMLETFSFDRRELGQPVFQSEVISAMQAVAGVSYVNLQTFDSVAEDVTVQQLAGLAGTLTLQPYIEVNLAQINLDPTADATSRILPAELAYLNAGIPDTLILNQVNP